MKPTNYTYYRREFLRRKAQTIYERLIEDADARREAIRREIVPLAGFQCADRDYETAPQDRRLRPVEYEAFPYQDRHFDYTPSNTAGQIEAEGWCFSGKHRVPVSRLAIKKNGRLIGLATSCVTCRERAANSRALAHRWGRSA